MTFKQRNNKGFTLLEMVLVLAIMSSILIMIIGYSTQRFDQFRRDKAAMQMEQILNAGLAYYTTNGQWPISLSTLQTANYLPSSYTSPYGGAYTIPATTTATGNIFQVSTTVTSLHASSDASTIAGMLPGGSVAGSTVTGQVVVPGQNLNNARSVNFGNIYNSGGCVPVPTCPSGMQPVIMTSVAAATGYYDPPVNCNNYGDESGCTPSAPHPIYGVVSYATGGPPTVSGGTGSGNTPPDCSNPTTSPGTQTCFSDTSLSSWPTLASGQDYWRVCLSIQVDQGFVVISGTPGSGEGSSTYWGQNLGSVLAITRCAPGPVGAPPTENEGSSLDVWSK